MTTNITKSVGSWESGAVNDRADVMAVQRMLTDVYMKIGKPEFNPHGTTGEIPKSQSCFTVSAITEFQRKVLGVPKPDGRVDPGGRTHKALDRLNGSTNFNVMQGVNSRLVEKIYSFIADFDAVNISSGRRTVRRQAELMAPMSDSDLNMYGSTSAYVVEIKAIPRQNRTADKVEKILQKATNKGSKISDHLQGNAVDISAQGAFDWTRAETIAKKLGLRPKNEKSRNCFHVSY